MKFLLQYRRFLSMLLLSLYVLGASASGDVFMRAFLNLPLASLNDDSCGCSSELIDLAACCCAVEIEELVADDSDSCCSEETKESTFIEAKYSPIPCGGEAEDDKQSFLAKHILLLTSQPTHSFKSSEFRAGGVYSFSLQEYIYSEAPVPIV